MPYKVPESFNTIAMVISTTGMLGNNEVLLCTGQSSSQSTVSSWVSVSKACGGNRVSNSQEVVEDFKPDLTQVSEKLTQYPSHRGASSYQ